MTYLTCRTARTAHEPPLHNRRTANAGARVERHERTHAHGRARRQLTHHNRRKIVADRDRPSRSAKRGLHPVCEGNIAPAQVGAVHHRATIGRQLRRKPHAQRQLRQRMADRRLRLAQRRQQRCRERLRAVVSTAPTPLALPEQLPAVRVKQAEPKMGAANIGAEHKPHQATVAAAMVASRKARMASRRSGVVASVRITSTGCVFEARMRPQPSA